MPSRHPLVVLEYISPIDKRDCCMSHPKGMAILIFSWLLPNWNVRLGCWILQFFKRNQKLKKIYKYMNLPILKHWQCSVNFSKIPCTKDFAYTVLSAWNAFPFILHLVDSFPSFLSQLKTLLILEASQRKTVHLSQTSCIQERRSEWTRVEVSEQTHPLLLPPHPHTKYLCCGLSVRDDYFGVQR